MGLITTPKIDQANKASKLALITGIGAIVAMLTNPFAGRLNDRTSSRFGMRRLWLLGGILVGLLGLYMVAVGDVTIMLVGWCVTQIGFNAVLASCADPCEKKVASLGVKPRLETTASMLPPGPAWRWLLNGLSLPLSNVGLPKTTATW